MKTELLPHYCPEPIGEIRDRATEQFPDMKPRGLWVSVRGEDDWLHWCLAEDFGLDRLTHAYEVTLAPGAKVLRLSTAEDIDAFTRDYPGTAYPGQRSGYAINWPAVAREFGGIIISPYIWNRRLCNATFWYYGWDCASGCIWRRSAIQSVSLHAHYRTQQHANAT